jgi:putative ABC transport system substrate-binding protein
LGWTDGGNIRIDIRWGAGVANRMREYAEELVALMPDAILASGSPSVGALQQSITKLPVVFTSVVDPVGAGFVASLARPGGNTTGFMLLEYSIGTKWLELLKDAEPRVTRVAVLRDPTLASGSGQFGAIQAVASSFGVELSPIGMRSASEIEDAVNAFAPGAKGGLIITASTLATQHRELIVALASRHRVPAVYSNRLFVTDGGLLSYSPDASTSSANRLLMLTASSRARSRPICRSCRRPSSNSSSICRPPRCSGSPCRRRCSRSPTR